MKQFFSYILFLIITFTGFAQKITFMPGWTEQSQFAGYYVALEKGFYKEEGLDVTIEHPAQFSTISSVDRLRSGAVQFITTHLPDALVAYEKGIKLVNVLQTSQNSSVLCVAKYPIKSIRDLDGMKIARWKAGYGYIFDFIMRKYRLNVSWVPYIQGVNLFVYGAVDAMLCYEYHEYYTLLLAIGSIDPKCVIRASDVGFNFPEDGIYVTQSYYEKHKDIVDKFVRASKKGWDYARYHFDEAYQYSLDRAHKKSLNISDYTQKMMLEKVLKLQINPETKIADYKPVSKLTFEKINNNLIDCGMMKTKVPYAEVIKGNTYIYKTK